MFEYFFAKLALDPKAREQEVRGNNTSNFAKIQISSMLHGKKLAGKELSPFQFYKRSGEPARSQNCVQPKTPLDTKWNDMNSALFLIA